MEPAFKGDGQATASTITIGNMKKPPIWKTSLMPGTFCFPPFFLRQNYCCCLLYKNQAAAENVRSRRIAFIQHRVQAGLHADFGAFPRDDIKDFGASSLPTMDMPDTPWLPTACRYSSRRRQAAEQDQTHAQDHVRRIAVLLNCAMSARNSAIHNLTCASFGLALL